VTRLSEQDLTRGFTPRAFAGYLAGELRTDVRRLAARAWDADPDALAAALRGKRVAAVTVTSGEGAIGGFARALADTGELMGAEARVMESADGPGFAEADRWGADIVVFSDDSDFVAADRNTGRVVHNNPATARVFVAALELLNGGSLKGEGVTVLGLGPVGFFAAERLMELGARPAARDVDRGRLFTAGRMLPGLDTLPGEEDLARALARSATPLIFEAVPCERALPDALYERLLGGPAPVVSAPGVPLSWPAAWLGGEGGRLFHEPLMAGTASMLAGLFAERYDERFSRAFP
jgi:pyrrolysine biosynthesis protein PylD